MKNLIALLFLFLPLISHTQTKKKIDHNTYDRWNTIANINQSESGNLVTYEINPPMGDGNLILHNLTTGIKSKIPRATSASIFYSESYISFLIKPEYDTIRMLKLDGVKKAKHPKDTLAIFWTETDSILKIPNIKSHKISEEGNWIVYLSSDDNSPKCPEKKKKKKKKKNACVEIETNGTSLTILNPSTSFQFEIHQVVDYSISKKGKYLAYTTSKKGDKDTISMYVINLQSMSQNINGRLNLNTPIIKNQYAINNIKFDDEGNQLLFLTSNDTNKKKCFQLGYWNSISKENKILIDSNTVGMPLGNTVSEFGRPYFSRNGRHIILGTNKIVEQTPEDTLLKSEKSKVDVWKWNDPKIQPQQLKNLNAEQKKSYKAIYHIPEGNFVQITDENLPSVQFIDFGNADFALGFSGEPYLMEHTWKYPWRVDAYFIDLLTGKRQLILEGSYAYGNLAPSGEHYVWFKAEDSCWYSKGIKTTKEINLTQKLKVNFASDLNGTPTLPFSQGSSGWIKRDGKELFVANSEFDIWLLDPSGNNSPISITNQSGITNKIKYKLVRLERDSTYIDINNILIHGKDDLTKDESYHQLSITNNEFHLTELIASNHKFTYISKANQSEKILFRRMNFTDYPNLESTTKDFTNPEKLTDANPQQSEYNWGSVEFVDWTSFEGKNLRGLLYKPEDFDSTKSYPMIVYFYETYSENINYHYVPKPTASIVYPTEYVSNGYIIFIPDIEYIPGHPAKSAYDCIVSGTDYLTNKHSWIDSNRLGLQGQSWGGYQTAQLITMTDKYSAAMAGAPVSNMFSAYGGVRWGSGLSRMFQYERTQSRIGYTIWEKPELYIENSPIFGLPSVTTPLLIMHNDGDGAVPWYQGIELYMGMRRLNKPAWLLNYNGDQHNLMQTANRKDLSIRMRQFFDYYLLGAPMPIWMKDGVPATDKGIDYGLELEKTTN